MGRRCFKAGGNKHFSFMKGTLRRYVFWQVEGKQALTSRLIHSKVFFNFKYFNFCGHLSNRSFHRIGKQK